MIVLEEVVRDGNGHGDLDEAEEKGEGRHEAEVVAGDWETFPYYEGWHGGIVQFEFAELALVICEGHST